MMFQDKHEDQQQTAIGEAMEKAGLGRLDFEMAASALRFIKEGAAREAYIEAWDRAFKSLPAPVKLAAGRQDGSVNARPVPASKPFTEEQIKKRLAETKERKVKREAAIRERVQVIKAKILQWDKKLTSANKPWGDVWDYEFPGMARDGTMVWAIREVIGKPNFAKPVQVREMMTPEQFERAVNLAREAA